MSLKVKEMFKNLTFQSKPTRHFKCIGRHGAGLGRFSVANYQNALQVSQDFVYFSQSFPASSKALLTYNFAVIYKAIILIHETSLKLGDLFINVLTDWVPAHVGFNESIITPSDYWFAFI